jgi:hypothetical protein
MQRHQNGRQALRLARVERLRDPAVIGREDRLLARGNLRGIEPPLPGISVASLIRGIEPGLSNGRLQSITRRE